MNKLSGSILIGVLMVSAPAFANSKLVKEKQCLQCHAVSKDTIGPSFKHIAKLWKGNHDAEKSLTATIQKGTTDGGGQHWEMKAKMPDGSERPPISDAEAKQIYKWIMRQ
ncbi:MULTISPECIES: c-type cytochrome [unclassified Acidovorax]|uniref:c-type cytochrome n=1 Tax=unclassified Acidovorax TaxID=2684926 RepID=UPI0006FF4A13|nr:MULTISPECIES: c-type cytochrome [unclassified Acidovorax]KRB39560.1 cytochrome C [Acidovorax sp. Root70]PUA95840.1 cytochrome c [Acidovorax sp. 107]